MIRKIYNALHLSMTYSSLDAKRLDNKLRDFINCISGNIFSDDDLDEARYITRILEDNILIQYILLDCQNKNKYYDTALRNDKKVIVIYRYNQDNMSNEDILRTIFNEIRYIMISIYGYKDEIEEFKYFNKLSSMDKLILLAPYIIISKLFDKLDIASYFNKEFPFQTILNPNNIKEINEMLKFIFTEHPDLDALLDLNAFLLPFNK